MLLIGNMVIKKILDYNVFNLLRENKDLLCITILIINLGFLIDR